MSSSSTVKKRTPPKEAVPLQEANSTSTSSTEAKVTLLADEATAKKWQNWRTRGWTTVLMLATFAFLVYLGHVALVGLVLLIQTLMYREIKVLGMVAAEEKEIPAFRPLYWYWFLLAIFFSYGKLLDLYFAYRIPYHSFISFALYSFGVVMFVMNLKRDHYKYQFGMFAWVHLTLFMVVLQTSFLIVNMWQGLIWFILPALLIVSNDCWAYIFGFFFGRTPLISLSPKKTWEGFMGAFFMTIATGFFLSRVLAFFPEMVCPKTDLALSLPTCQPSVSFQLQQYDLPTFVVSILSQMGIDWHSVNIMPVQIHGLFLAIFASAIAPFAGFFASGFKRAFNIKDFGNTIPGHGGITDRFDCQVMMGLFAYVYYWNFVQEAIAPNALSSIVSLLSYLQPEEKAQLLKMLQNSINSSQ